MLGAYPDCVPSQAETLAARFVDDGWAVRLTSSARHPVSRAACVGADLLRWRHSLDVTVVNVFSGRAFAHADLATAVSRGLRGATVLHLHGGDLPAFAARRPGWVRRVLARAQAIVAPSEYLAGVFRPLGFDVSVIPNVVVIDDHPFRLREAARPDLLWLRAFEPLYRPMLALQAFALVRRRWPEATLTMAGPDGGLLADIQRAAASMGLGASVRLPGVLDPVGLRRAFDTHDVLLTTSRIDNAPLSVLEAAASGLPVVAAAVGGLPYLITDGHDGLLVADGDADALAAAVVRVVTEPTLAARLSANGRKLAERSAWPAVRPRWEALLAGLPAAGRRRRT